MEEIALRWIERVGFPIFAACASSAVLGYVIYKLFGRYETVTKELRDVTDAHRKEMIGLSHESNAALERNTQVSRERNVLIDENTVATRELTRKMGSDPDKICKADQILKSAGIECKAEEILKILKQQGKI